jgi:signal transduction histidine kinase
LYDGENAQAGLRQATARGWLTKAAQLEFARGERMLGNILVSGDIFFSTNLARDQQVKAELRDLAPENWSALAVPIRTENDIIGVFIVSAALPRDFTSEDARLIITLTEMAGNAIHRMRLTEQTMHHAAVLELRVAERTAELQTALQKAQEADRVKSDFIANINHELRTPLTNLVLYYQLLRAQPSVKTEERLDVIGRELQRLRNLIEDLLNLSRLEQGAISFRPIPTDLNRLIRNLVNDRQVLAEERRLAMVTELQADLAPVELDEPTMNQVISNLLTNALNYTPPEGLVCIRTEADPAGVPGEVCISVQDTGPGISPEDLPHLFERFYRGQAGHTSGAPGTGLGLSIVKQVVERHRGRIEVRNGSEGMGAVFNIYLPIKQNQESG